VKTHLLHRDIEVRLVDHIVPDADEGFNYGQTVADDGNVVVIIAGDIKHDVDVVDTVIHEFLHVIEGVCGLELTHSQVYTMAAGLTQMLVGLNLVQPPAWRAQLNSQQALENKP
jgi:hypothetical protein